VSESFFPFLSLNRFVISRQGKPIFITSYEMDPAGRQSEFLQGLMALCGMESACDVPFSNISQQILPSRDEHF
jgi:hypothetical protein